MRGSKNGLEKLQSNHLDIDGDSCHHIHNAAKKCTKHFDAHLKLLFINIYNDFKWSEDLREILKEICFQMNAKYIFRNSMLQHADYQYIMYLKIL